MRPEIEVPECFNIEPTRQAFDAGVEAMIPHIEQIEAQLRRLQKIEVAALIVVRQTNAARAYVLHDELIQALNA